jgi:hypothetical protein
MDNDKLYTIARQRSHQNISSKDFPRPFPYPLTRTSEDHVSRPPVARLQYTRNLAGITGVILDPRMESVGTAPTGLGEGVDKYLDAHGYDSSSRLHIMYAWRENCGIQDFITYVCERGMVKAEAKWLWQLIIEHY